MRKYYNWNKLQQLNDRRGIAVALAELERVLQREVTATDLLSVIWDDHLKVIAY